MQTAIIILHVLLCLFLILVILLQTGKGGDMGAVFGGSSSSTFGGQGAGTFLSRTTSVVAALFMITSLALAILSSRVDEQSVISDDIVPIQSTAPLPPPAKPRMETDPEATKVKPTPTTKAVEPAQIPENARKEGTAIPTSTARVKSGSEEKKPVPATAESPNPSKAPQKDEKTTPPPDPTTP
jgi:preprotein translocase subunit SecG